MKTQAFAALFIAALSTSAFALPAAYQPVLGESKDSSSIQIIEPVAEGGSDRTGANRIAEGGSDRTHGFRVAEGGSDRTNALRVAEGGADRVPQAQRIS
ncbi:hypothetical protein [Pseudomonas sp. JG-B]|uniref:hypothetical protein n=1 Tax=Pseudomonas sp. JG-B TaxID=2603214 RepID=UPI00129EB0EE|nr:hypothetical protein [Pseudomonas sp. JG-B]MRK19916.1 hypothetical protein [Pseudomonas sp. JG-B]